MRELRGLRRLPEPLRAAGLGRRGASRRVRRDLVLLAERRAGALPGQPGAGLAALAEPLAVAPARRLGRVPGHPERAVIIGYGPIGALVHLALTAGREPPSEVTVIEPARARRELAAALGAAVADRDEIAARPAARRPQLVVDAAGIPARWPTRWP